MDVSLRSADEYCRQLTRGHYENFVVAAPFLAANVRLDLARFYAYCRTTDDLGDESGVYAGARLARWRSEVEAMFAGEPPVHPVLYALRETIARRMLPSQPFLDLIAANEQDQVVKSYESWPQLEAYCMLSAAPVGRVVLRIFDLDSASAARLSDDVCIGLQLANHAQDVSRDERIGRSYLIASDVRNGGIVSAVKALTERARALLASGRKLETMAPFALKLQLALYRLGGLAICDAIERLEYATDKARPAIGGTTLAGVLVHALCEAAFPQQEARDAKPA